MSKKATLPFPWHSYGKYAGLGIIIIILGNVLINHFGDLDFILNRTAHPLSFGLMLIFFSMEAVNDERIIVIKYKALATGFFLSYMISVILNLFFVNYNSAMSAFWFIIIVMIVTLVVFAILKARE